MLAGLPRYSRLLAAPLSGPLQAFHLVPEVCWQRETLQDNMPASARLRRGSGRAFPAHENPVHAPESAHVAGVLYPSSIVRNQFTGVDA